MGPAGVFGGPGVALHLLVLTLVTSTAAGQCAGTETFEKLTRMIPQGATGVPLYSNTGDTVTKECLSRCKQSNNCLGVLVNYGREACFSLDPGAVARSGQLTPTDQPITYFHKICINAPPCGRNWMLERVVGFEVDGYDDIVVNDVASREKCAELCIRERGLKCRSAEYHQRDGVCRLSRQDRRTQPLSFRPASSYVHYLENQCAGVSPQPQQRCEFEELPQQDLGHGDLQISATDTNQCRNACDNEVTFNCRSFSWYARAGVCRLSGDDLLSTGPSAIVPLPGATLFQRAPCLDLDLSCSVDGMTVQLNTPEPFHGRLFSRDYPASCQSTDKESTETLLTIKFSDSECGAVDEGNGIYSNVIVVQNHPVIQRRGDKAIKLMCLFETSNKTITDTFNFIVDNSINAGVATAIVNATAPSPRIRLRIVDRNGNDINGARLGEELFLRLELDDDSVYGILARNLVAKSGDNANSIILLDERGCPADPVIFPSLQPVPGSKSLQGKFEAFKFSEDQVVRFQVNVQFCLEECRPADCGSVISYGRRRRRTAVSEGGLITLDGELSLVDGEVNLLSDEEDQVEGEVTLGGDDDTIYHEMPLQKEIIVDSSTVKPLSTGLLPEETDARRLAQLVCTSREVLIAILVSAAILQICIILIAIMCVVARRRKPVTTVMTQDSRAPSLSRRGRRSPYTITTEDSLHTLKSLRTSLRD